MFFKYRILLILIIMGLATVVEGNQAINLPMNSTEIAGQVDLGDFQINGFGIVHLTVKREGNRLIVFAAGEKGSVIGKAETTIGLKETPLYLKTKDGLQAITLHWRKK